MTSYIAILSNTHDYEAVKPEIPQLEKLFEANAHVHCLTLNDLDKIKDSIKAVVYIDGINTGYADVIKLYKAVPNIENVIGIVRKGAKAWIYDKEIIADCVTTSKVWPAVVRAVKIANYSQSIGTLVTVLLCIVLLISFLRPQQSQECGAAPIHVAQPEEVETTDSSPHIIPVSFTKESN